MNGRPARAGLSIRQRLTGGYCLIAAIFAAASYSAAKATRTLGDAFAVVQQQTVPAIRCLDELKLHALRIVASVSEFGLIQAERAAGSPAAAREGNGERGEEDDLIRAGIKGFSEVLAEYERLTAAHFPGEVRALDAIRSAGMRLQKTGLELVGLKKRGVSGRDILKAKGAFEVEERAFLALVDAALRGKEDDLARHRQGLESLAAAVVKGTILLGVLAFAAAILIGGALTRHVAIPLSRLRDAVAAVEKGELGTVVEPSSSDELGQLADAFNRMSGALRRMSDYLNDVLEHMADLLIVTDSRGDIQMVNGAAVELLGYPKEELLGRPASRLFPVAKAAAEEVHFFKGAWLEELARKGVVRDLETSLAAKDGRSIPALLSGSLLRDRDGRVQGIVAVIKDMTARKEMELRLVQGEKMAAMGQLVGGLAHEINNPLGIILGFAQSAVRRIDAGSPLALPLRSIEREAVRCKELVENLLAFSRSSRPEQREEVDLNDCVQQVLLLVWAQAKVKGIQVLPELDKNPPRLKANKNQIQQILVNLCCNAIDAMPGGGVLTVRARRADRCRGDRVEIVVSDTGTGIPETIRGRIFDPFFTTKEPGKGTGLGLALVHDIVGKHGGEISFESREGGGTTFTVALPAAGA